MKHSSFKQKRKSSFPVTTKAITVVVICVIFLSLSIPVSAARNYSFESGADSKIVFAQPTGTDAPVIPKTETENQRRNKDAANNPLPYGKGSGDFPTDSSSMYHDNSPAYSGYSNNGTSTASASINTSQPSGSVYANDTTDYGNILPSTSLYSSEVLNILPLYYNDGSIGTLSIPKLNLTVKVYEGETLENMRVGVGHFEFTSAWDGNVSISGHNRGVPAAIGNIKNLFSGDKVIYETKYGTRTYEVYNKVKISDTDYSGLGWSAENIISMITCVENEPAYRWLVQARQIS